MKTVSSGPLLPDADIYLPGHSGTLARRHPRPADRLIEYYSQPHPRSAEKPADPQALLRGIPETVIRPDERRVVDDTVTYPFSAICSLEIVNTNLEKFYGTGFLAGPRLVLTAGHNVYFHGEEFMKQITVYPGLNADRGSPRLRSTKAHRLLTVESWVNDADQQFNFGAIVLPTDLGHEAGWLSISNFTESTLASMTVTIAGYPQHPPSGSSPRDASGLSRMNIRVA